MLFGIVCAWLVVLLTPAGLHAATIPTSPTDESAVKTESPLLITGLSTTAHRLNYIQLHNESDEVYALDGWRVSYTVADTEFELPVEIAGMVKPGASVVIADETSVPSAAFLYSAPDVLVSDTLRVTQLRLAAPEQSGYLDHIVEPNYPSDSVASDTTYTQRNRSTSTGNFLASMTTRTEPPETLAQDELYVYPDETPLRIVEILANPRSCSPSMQTADCQDYVKLYNPTSSPIDLTNYRLRVGYGGQSATSSNTVYLGEVLDAGAYASYAVGVTNSGGFTWIEDRYGAKQYDETVVEYMDASDDSKKGYSWALGMNGWSWATPQPSAANVVLPEAEAELVASGLTPCDEGQYRNPETNRCKNHAAASTLTPCRADQYRSEETNRCRNIASEASLKPCRADQYRNPETNRCRSISSTSSSLVPCKTGQYRNPETNRCKSLTAASSDLKPCAANQERNPETNRCRKKIQGDGDAGFAVVDSSNASDDTLSWLALGGVGAVSLGYAGWEWRRELWGGVSKVLALLPWVK